MEGGHGNDNGTKKKVTFARNNCKTTIGFIMVRKNERSMITDMNLLSTRSIHTPTQATKFAVL